MTTSASRVRCDIDFDRHGRQASYLRAPQSRNTSGWGVVEIPIYVFKNGSGPTLLLTGGVHGDEYEGQIALSRLAQTLKPEDFVAVVAFDLRPEILSDFSTDRRKTQEALQRLVEGEDGQIEEAQGVERLGLVHLGAGVPRVAG